MKSETNKTQQGISYTIGGGTVLGIGTGFLTGNLTAFALIGLGLGLVTAAIITFSSKK